MNGQRCHNNIHPKIMMWKSCLQTAFCTWVHLFKGRSIWIEEREERKDISGIYLFFKFKMSIQEEIRLNITIIWHNKPSKGRIFQFLRTNDYFHFLNIQTRQLWITKYILLISREDKEIHSYSDLPSSPAFKP